MTSAWLRPEAAALCSAAATPPAEGWDALDMQTFPRPNMLFVTGAELGVGLLSELFFGGIVAAALLHCAL